MYIDYVMLCNVMFIYIYYSRHLWILEIFVDQVGLPEGQLSVFIKKAVVWHVLLQLHAPVSSSGFQHHPKTVFCAEDVFMVFWGIPTFKNPRVRV